MLNIESLTDLPPEELQEVLDTLSPQEAVALRYKWEFWARPAQLMPPGDWNYWLALAGRGWGKTRVGAEWSRHMIETGQSRRMHFIAPTNADLRDVMVEGESGILECCPPWNMPTYEPSKKRITWPNGAIVSLYSAEEPERLRGPQCDAFWADELAAWTHLDDTWSNLQFGFRLGRHPRGIITTTPRPLPLVKRIAKMSSSHVTTGSTYDNRSNLAKPFFDEVITAYEGTRLGRQELNGEILEDNPNAVFRQEWFDQHRLEHIPGDLDKIAVSVDPNVKEDLTSDEAGIVVGGMKRIDGIKHYYVTADNTTAPGSTDAWARESVRSYFAAMADIIVAEVNNGGDLVVKNIHSVNEDVPVEKVTATRGKTIRAEPVTTLCEQGRVHLCGHFGKLEDECVQWDPTLKNQKSPNRMDAFVWLITFLSGMKGRGMVQGRAMGR